MLLVIGRKASTWLFMQGNIQYKGWFIYSMTTIFRTLLPLVGIVLPVYLVVGSPAEAAGPLSQAQRSVDLGSIEICIVSQRVCALDIVVGVAVGLVVARAAGLSPATDCSHAARAVLYTVSVHPRPSLMIAKPFLQSSSR